MNEHPSFHRAPGTKLVAVGAIGLLLGLPLLIVGSLQWERERRAREVVAELSHAGGRQVVHGPILQIPYTYPVIERLVGTDGTSTETIREAHGSLYVSPDTLDVEVGQRSRVLRRGIFEVPAHASEIQLVARLARLPDVAWPEGAQAKWSEARWLLGVSDLRGVGRVDLDQRQGAEVRRLEFEAVASPVSGWANLAAPAALGGAPKDLVLEGALSVSGAESLHFGPAGHTTRVRVGSDWPHPSFDGSHLPAERSIGDGGFEARWAVSNHARGLPRVSTEGIYLAGQELGVRLVRPGDGYAQVGRSLKYALFFVGLVLTCFFLLELASGVRVHPAQYGLLGLAQVVFYLLLLALSEHGSIELAYLLAGTATSALSGVYALWTFGQPRFAAVVLAGTGVAYAFQYALVQLEDHALLVGAWLAFAVVATLMFATRRVRWYRGSA